MSLAAHPCFALFDAVPERQRHYVQVDECPGCGKPIRIEPRYLTYGDKEHGLIALSAICWRCAHRLEHSSTRGEEILQRIERTFKLVTETAGCA
jgi:hypothetical protein